MTDSEPSQCLSSIFESKSTKDDSSQNEGALCANTILPDQPATSLQQNNAHKKTYRKDFKNTASTEDGHLAIPEWKTSATDDSRLRTSISSTETLLGGTLTPADLEGNDAPQLREDQEPKSLGALNNTDSQSLPASDRSALSPADWLARSYDALRESQYREPNRSPRFPTQEDFPRVSLIISEAIREPDKPVQDCIVFLPRYASSESSLKGLASRLKTKNPESALILLRGPQKISSEEQSYSWGDSDHEHSNEFLESFLLVLVTVIRKGLVEECGFQPRNIVIIGLGQGGTAALTMAAIWERIEFGGIVSIGGPPSKAHRVSSKGRAKTPSLTFDDPQYCFDDEMQRRLAEDFICDHYDMQPFNDDGTLWSQEIEPSEPSEPLKPPQSSEPSKPYEPLEPLEPLFEFLAHRLRRDEWTKQAVISFDGGGIRGLGSLYILRELMRKIGIEERRLDKRIESSFSPHLYKPTKAKYTDRRWWRKDSEAAKSANADDVVGTKIHKPDAFSSLFLPCHYFDYAAGTSTGGLISIMLSCLRMTVDDCIEEYKILGERIFGRPRYLSCRGVLWNKFNSKSFKRVIEESAGKHSVQSRSSNGFGLQYEMDEKLCRCLVLAYPDNHIRGDIPYLFRTYPAPPSALDQTMAEVYEKFTPDPKCYPWGLSLSLVAQATSAAPGYFSPVKVLTARRGEPGEVDWIKFKDGGFGSNNPSEEAFYDIVDSHGGLSKNLAIFISIGTGHSVFNKFSKREGHLPDVWANFKAVKAMATCTTLAHRSMEKHANHDRKNVFQYHRFDGGLTLGAMELDEWEEHKSKTGGESKVSGARTVQSIEEAIESYVNQKGVQHDLDKCARLLVKRRRMRARNESEWKRYSSATFYMCDHQDCKDARSLENSHNPSELSRGARFKTEQDFKLHLDNAHCIRDDDDAISQRLKDCERYWWLYPGWNTPKSSTPS